MSTQLINCSGNTNLLQKYASPIVVVDSNGFIQSFINSGVPTITSGSINFNMTGNGFPLNSGYQGTLVVPYSLTPQTWNLIGDISGNLQVDIRRQTYAVYNGESMPSSASVCAGAFPNIGSSVKGTGSASTWSVLNTSDVIEINIPLPPSGVTLANLSLIYTKN